MSDLPVILDARDDLRPAGWDEGGDLWPGAEYPAPTCDPLFEIVVL